MLDNQIYPKSNYLERQPELTDEDRQILINWLLIIQVEFRLLPETIQLTVNLIDRYLSNKSVAILDFQLLGITAMFIACKFYELYPPVISDFVHVTKNSSSKT